MNYFYCVGGEYSSAFSKSVKVHVASLVRAGKTVQSPYLQKDSDREKEIEREVFFFNIHVFFLYVLFFIMFFFQPNFFSCSVISKADFVNFYIH